MALVISTWLWGDKYGIDDVRKLRAGVRHHLKQDHRFILVTNNHPGDLDCEVYPIRDESLTHTNGCFARLRMFDPEWQKSIGLEAGDRLANIDLDTVITGALDPLFDRPEPFVILQGGNASNPCPYGGALVMLRAGAHPDVWSDFSLEAAAKTPSYEFPDDQGWIAHKIPDAAGWKAGTSSGVFVFRKPGWPSYDKKMKRGGDDLPVGARLVTFNGGRCPEKFKHLPWVKENWR